MPSLKPSIPPVFLDAKNIPSNLEVPVQSAPKHATLQVGQEKGMVLALQLTTVAFRGDSELKESHMFWSSNHFLTCTGSHLPCVGHLQASKLLQGTSTGIQVSFNVLSPSSQPCPGWPPERDSLTGSEILSPSKLFFWSMHAWIQQEE